jgi:hypothetical protein
VELARPFLKKPKRQNFVSDGNTPLHLAVIKDQAEEIPALLRQEGLSRKKNLWEMTPCDLAHFLGRRRCLFLLEEKPKNSLLVYQSRDQSLSHLPIEEAEKRLKFQYIDSLEFASVDILRWAAKKCQKRLRKTSYSQMNRWILALYAEGIEKKECSHIYLRWIDSYIGYGIFASREIPALTYIGEYTGVVKLRRKRKNRFNDYVFGYVTGPKETPFVIDAQDKGNFTRFINHSNTPNLNSRWVITRGVTRIILFSNRLILKGTQLTYDYGNTYWRSRYSPELL